MKFILFVWTVTKSWKIEKEPLNHKNHQKKKKMENNTWIALNLISEIHYMYPV